LAQGRQETILAVGQYSGPRVSKSAS
jgi:hypothetical protein